MIKPWVFGSTAADLTTIVLGTAQLCESRALAILAATAVGAGVWSVTAALMSCEHRPTPEFITPGSRKATSRTCDIRRWY